MSQNSNSPFIGLYLSLNIVPHNEELFELALTHSSYNSDANTKHHDYERLEFIGDSVIGYIVADLIYKNKKDMEPGDMSKLKSYLVKSHSLATLARSLHLQDYIRVGNSIDREKMFQADNVLEDVCESLVGALYLDQGLEFTYDLVKEHMLPYVLNTDEDVIIDYKTKLQEDMQTEYRESVQYVLDKVEGPAHDRTFTVSVIFNGMVLAQGTGKRKKDAEEDAAKNALKKRSV
ncbi:MAG: ribonuclease III [Coprobacillus sp.]|nr:ribonuclease III [Coprobacillus sp.]